MALIKGKNLRPWELNAIVGDFIKGNLMQTLSMKVRRKEMGWRKAISTSESMGVGFWEWGWEVSAETEAEVRHIQM